jgi:HEAT repeat protein
MNTVYIEGMTIDELASLFDCDIKNDDDFYDVVAYNIVKKSPNYFFETKHNYNNTQIRASIFGVGFIEDKNTQLFKYLESYLNSDDPFILSEVVDTYINIGEKSKWNIVKNLLNHESPYVRGAALRYCRFCLPNRDAFKVLIHYLKDSSYIVRENAVDELAELKDKSAIEHILPLCDDEHKDVQAAAKEAIENLSL